MSWKTFFIAFFNIICIVFPYNIIGCLEPPDPYDQYSSFFRNDLSPAKSLSPFYYVNDYQIYSPVDADTSTDEACTEWIRYCHRNLSVSQVHSFICRTPEADLLALQTLLTKQHKHPLPPGLRKNPMTGYFLQGGDTTALQYIRFARSTEPFRIAGGQTWDDRGGWKLTRTDSLAMNALIEKAILAYQTAHNDFIRARYGFQTVSLCYYNRRNQDCIRFFGTMLQNKKAAGSLYAQALSFKAGARLRLRQNILAAYDYSRAFSLSRAKLSNYLSFSWCISRKNNTGLDKCLALCRNDREKADLIGLFCLGSPGPEATAMKKIYLLDPSSPVLEILALREINKIEDHYFTPRLSAQPGGKTIYIQEWGDNTRSPDKERWRKEAILLAAWYDTISRDPAIPHQGLYATAAAHLCYIIQQYPFANQLLDRAASLPGDEKLRSQQAMTRLLVTINQYPIIDSTAEKALLPSLRWLERLAKNDGKGMHHPVYDSWSNSLWQQFYRNLLAEILAKRYHQQGEKVKEILCIGAGEKMVNIRRDEDFYPTDITKTQVQDNLSTKDLRILRARLYSPSGSTAWERYLGQRFPMTPQELTICMAVSLTRDHRWREALGWYGQVRKRSLLKLDRNPFGECLLDRQDSTLPSDKGHFDRIAFLQRMAMLDEKAQTGKASPQELYQMGLGYYNMTYYGRAWETVQFGRTGKEWDELPFGKTAFEKDYYGCYTAEKYFLLARQASNDRNFEARCLFMMAKCAQKQGRIVWVPGRTGKIGNLKAEKLYHTLRIGNEYFPMLQKEYSNTPFFREAVNTCSYLGDFVKRHQNRPV